MMDDALSIDSNYISDGEIRPQTPARPTKKPSLSQLTIASSSKKKIDLQGLRSQPTTEVSLENIGKEEDDILDTERIYNTLNHYDSTNYDTSTIRTNPTLTVFTDDDILENTLENLLTEAPSDFILEIEDSEDEEYSKKGKQFYILSSAGKLIYSMTDDNQENSSTDKVLEYVGIVQTVLGSFLLDGSNLKSIVAGSTRYTILNQTPIILLAVSSVGESELELLNQLDMLYTFLLSALSKPHILRAFQNKESFDLGKHLGRADLSGLDSLCQSMIDGNVGILVGALQCIRLKKSVRDKIKHILLHERSSNVLYGFLVAPEGKLINILRPKTHTLHTTDLHILFSIVFGQSKSYSEDEELWLPICLPKFNSNGFLYAFVRYLKGVTLILVSPDKNTFFEMRETAKKMISQLESTGSLAAVSEAASQGFSPVDVPAPLVRHFIYKSKRHLQYVMSSEDSPSVQGPPSHGSTLRHLYRQLHADVDRTIGTSLVYTRWRHSGKNDSGCNTEMAGLGWSTPSYELYLVAGGVVRREVLVRSAKAIASWCHKYEERLFVCEGAVF